jgi:hypothetical protein
MRMTGCSKSRINPEGKSPPERFTCRWQINIKILIKETGWGCVDCVHVTQGRDR